MSIATVVTRGYGSFGTIGKVVTAGYSVGAATTVFSGYTIHDRNPARTIHDHNPKRTVKGQ